MSRAHLRLDGTWGVCHATQRACPRLLHLDDLTPQQAARVPDFFISELLAVLDPPTETQNDLQLWHDTHGLLHRDHDLPAVVEPASDGGEPRYQAWHTHGRFRQRSAGRPNRITVDRYEWWTAEGSLMHEMPRGIGSVPYWP